MTTQVTIKKTDTHNTMDVLVETVNPSGSDLATETHRLSDGEEVSLYVYDTQEIHVTEVDKKE